MNIKFAIAATKRYGFKGVLDYSRRILTGDKTTQILQSHTQDVTPIPGITIVGRLDLADSLCKVLRDLAIMLKQANIPCQVLNIPSEHPIPDSEYKYLLTPECEFVTNKYSDIIAMRQALNISDKRCRVHSIEFWEFEDGFKEAQPETAIVHNLIAMSDFNYETFKKTLPRSNVRKILYPFQFKHGLLAQITKTRQKYDIPEDTFMIFFNFSFCSCYFRKNPEAILLAFRKAFTKNEKAVIVFKTMGSTKCPAMNDRLHALAHELQMDNQLITIDNYIPQEDLVNLTNACDAYISLHRGEGFGLGIAEAMALGKPVIVTDYSSTTEFCKPDNALLIPYKLVPLKPDQHDVSFYNHVSKWAEPDINAAAKALRQLYDNPSLRCKLGTNAKTFIEDYFSVEYFKKSVEAFLRK